MRRLLAALPLFASSLHATPDATLLQEDFSQLSPGMFSTGVIGAQIEYHYLPLAAPQNG